MTGLSVLYANQAMKERGWADVPDRNKVSRLRETDTHYPSRLQFSYSRSAS